jgi:hypothetical protein
VTNKRLDDITIHLSDQSRRIDETNKRIDAVREELTHRIDTVREDLAHKIDETNQRLDRLYEVIVRRDEHDSVSKPGGALGAAGERPYGAFCRMRGGLLLLSVTNGTKAYGWFAVTGAYTEGEVPRHTLTDVELLVSKILTQLASPLSLSLFLSLLAGLLYWRGRKRPAGLCLLFSLLVLGVPSMPAVSD